jgi:hypothetical protein
MPKTFALWILAALLALPAASRLTAQESRPPAGGANLDYDFFKTKVQPIFLAKRPGHARCVSCHAQGTPMRLQELSPGAAGWNEEQSKKNFDMVRKFVNANDPMKSMLLIHPLATTAGGDLFHNGGKHWTSQSDAEWQTLLAWAKGKR